METARSISRFAGVSIEWLLTGTDSGVVAPVPSFPEPQAAPSPRQATEARRQASRALAELDGIDEKEAAYVVQNIDIPDDEADDAMAYYSLARKKLTKLDAIPTATLTSNERIVHPPTPVNRATRKRQ